MTQPKYGVGICLTYECDGSIRSKYIGPALDIEEYGVCLGCGKQLYGLLGTEIIDIDPEDEP